ncbi:hypothetical protein SS50377_26022 [Spironucleus salmonicida]|uniref:Uncharacterized protein n=1 Tax=Spironucleus salmonicida TaxID=348837 RepID=A0A9P8LPC1_9EUKA|nr:hypothetical protein SS50377_26022 [Spironucleus salmonicida]
MEVEALLSKLALSRSGAVAADERTLLSEALLALKLVRARGLAGIAERLAGVAVRPECAQVGGETRAPRLAVDTDALTQRASLPQLAALEDRLTRLGAQRAARDALGEQAQGEAHSHRCVRNSAYAALAERIQRGVAGHLGGAPGFERYLRCRRALFFRQFGRAGGAAYTGLRHPRASLLLDGLFLGGALDRDRLGGVQGALGAHEVGQEHAVCAAAAVLRLRYGDLALLADADLLAFVGAFEAAVRADPADRRQVQWRRIADALVQLGAMADFDGVFGAVRAGEPGEGPPRIPHALDTAAREEADALRAEVLARQEEAFAGLGARYRAIAAAEAGNQPHAIPPRPDFGRECRLLGARLRREAASGAADALASHRRQEGARRAALLEEARRTGAELEARVRELRGRPLSDRAFLLVQRALIDAGAAGRAGSRCRSAGGPRSAAGAAGCSGVPQ